MIRQIAPITLTVRELKLEQEIDYETPGYPKRDVTRVSLWGTGPGAAILTLTIQPDEPVPFALGQRLALILAEPADETEARTGEDTPSDPPVVEAPVAMDITDPPARPLIDPSMAAALAMEGGGF